MKKEKSIIGFVIGYRHSSKKLESLDQSGILLRRNNDCDVIKVYLTAYPIARKKVYFLISSGANK